MRFIPIRIFNNDVYILPFANNKITNYSDATQQI